MSDELTRLRAENQKLREEVARLREALRAVAPKAAADEPIEWGYRRGDLEDDLGVE